MQWTIFGQTADVPTWTYIGVCAVIGVTILVAVLEEYIGNKG